MTGRVWSIAIGRSTSVRSLSGLSALPMSPQVTLIGHTQSASGHFQCQRPVKDRHCMLSATTDRTQDPSVRSLTERFQRSFSATGRVRSSLTGHWDRTLEPSVRSLCDQCPVHSMRPYLFGAGRRWHRRTVRTLCVDTPLVKFRSLLASVTSPS